MAELGLVLGFFRSQDAATEVLRQLRRKGFHRSASIHKGADGLVSLNQKDISDRQMAAVGGACGLWLGSLLPLPSSLRALPFLAGGAVGWAAAHVIDLGVDDEVLTSYQPWVMRGETLIIVQTSLADMARAFTILRQTDDGQPTIFVVRPRQFVEPRPYIAPLRQELFTAEHLKEHAIRLAGLHHNKLTHGRRHSLLKRLQDNEKVIIGVNQSLADAARLEQPVSLSAEWLLDNAYIIEGQIEDVRLNLSRRFYAELPLITQHSRLNVPRIYAMAVELVAHTHARIDSADLLDFIAAYQTVSPLTMGELWALPLMLRLALVENLRRLAVQIDRRQRERERADFWANRLLNAAHHDPNNVSLMMADLVKEHPHARSPFTDRLVSHLYDEETALAPVRGWLERKLDAKLPEIIQREQRRHAADQVLVSNTITSLRSLGQMDWREAFEQLSLVERTLRNDPAGVYAQMDFGTRDHYRHEVERIAKGSRVSQLKIAERVVTSAAQVLQGNTNAPQESASPDGDTGNLALTDSSQSPALVARQWHIGYFLIDEGQRQLEAEFRYRPPQRERVIRWVVDHSNGVYFGGIGLGTLVGCLMLVRKSGLPTSPLLGALALLPSSELASQVVNYLVTKIVPPRPLPKMSFEQGVPDEFRTIVVVPMLLLSPEAIRDEVNRLEVHYLANPDPNLQFALLADYKDAPAAEVPEDEELLATAVRGIEELNARYSSREAAQSWSDGDGSEQHEAPPPSATRPPFFLFHRERSWHPSEQRWMGWERKRGKLEHLNKYLRGQWNGSPLESHPVVGDGADLQGIRFVITVDADTQLPQGSARSLIETLAHPLNHPRLRSTPDANGRDVVGGGYGIIQPLVSSSLPSATATRFSRLFSDPTGSDPYTHVISDVYQDLFGEGSYHGKGIYDVDAFHDVLTGRFPDAKLLSHDLLEGAHLRVGLASDIELYDQFPPNYQAYCKRQHRWIRGDWQILDWITKAVPTGDSVLHQEAGKGQMQRTANPLSWLNRWKVFDNLRRSLVAPATVVLLGAGWLLSPQTAAATSLIVGYALFFPIITQVGDRLTSKPDTVPWASRQIGTAIGRTCMMMALLPHQAALSLDAVVRVWYRRVISGQNMLEWETAQVSYLSAGNREYIFLLRLTGSTVFAAILGLVILLRNPLSLRPAAPFLTMWALAPVLVKWLSGGKRVPQGESLSDDDRQMLRSLARQTWRFFDDFVGPQTNWLPPDNYQESLRIEIAQRTSPTNVGLWLLAILAAHDFGYLPLDEVVARALPTLESIDELELYNGHLLNWYNVQTLEPLRPRYVSAVDSGNLLGSLWTMIQGCRSLLGEPLIGPESLRGLCDTLTLLKDAMEGDNVPESFKDSMQTLAHLCDSPPTQPHEIITILREAITPAQQLASALSISTIHVKPGPRERTNLHEATSDPRFVISPPSYWAAQVGQQLNHWLQLVSRYLLWIELLAEQPDEFLLPLSQEALAYRREALSQAPSLVDLARGEVRPIQQLLSLRERLPQDDSSPLVIWFNKLDEEFSRARWLAGEMLAKAETLIDHMSRVSDEMDMSFLYDEKRKLFTVGFSVDEMRLDASHYDLLATECRIGSLVAIARGDVPVDHWLTLGRRFGNANGILVLLSWSGTMFEYLMPLLFTRNYENSLLDLACKNAVARQIAYGKQRGIPWGISEAAFSALDANNIYQYKAFGVPGLGLKRGLESDLVVAPYASALALAVDPANALQNLKRLATYGMRGDYGFYESIDFTRPPLDDLEPGEQRELQRRSAHGLLGTIVRTFMVHHQGMSLLAFDNLLHNDIMRDRFHADPYIAAATPLLYERIPGSPPVLEKALPEARAKRLALDSQSTSATTDRFLTPDTPTPRVHLLSNRNYSVMLTNAGGGYSRWHDFEITRWRADTTRDNWGNFIYLRDLETSVVWSTTHQPVRRAARFASTVFRAEKAEFLRRDAEIETSTEVFVSPEDDAEIRRVTLVNHSQRTRQIELTSYAELALAPHNADRAHPAFIKLFVQTEALPEHNALLAWRRLRSPEDPSIWAAHIVTCSERVGETQYETDRARFLGRGRTAENPVALEGDLSNTAGAVLDPVFSLRQRVSLAPGQRIEVSFVTAAAESRDRAVELVDKYADGGSIHRAADMAWTHAQLEMHHLRIQAEDGLRFQQLASYMLYPSSLMRAPAKRLRENHLSQSGLWAHGISGDLPIMLVTIDNMRDIGLVRQALQAHTYWRVRGFKADLVILNDQGGGYAQNLSEDLKNLIYSHIHYTGMDQPGGVFLRSAENMPEQDLTLLLESARVLLVAARGTLAQQLGGTQETPVPPPRLTLTQRFSEEPSTPLPFMDLPYFNGTGGFTTDGREYAIYLGPGQQTPAPWINVMANSQFGTIVSDSGQGFTWYGNSQANRLTPWSNDPISDIAQEAIYIRDEDMGVFWTPTPLPIRELDAYRVRHGQGYTIFEHNSHAIEQELTTFVPVDANGGVPIRLQRLRLRNTSSRRRRLTITAYNEWVLGSTREEAQTHVVTTWDTENRILFARNAYQPDFGSRTAFASASPAPRSFSADRTLFLGRNGSPTNPSAMRRRHLGDTAGPGLDPCAAVQVGVELDPGQATEITFMLGETANVDEAQQLVRRFRSAAQVETALRTTREWWDSFLNTLQVDVPDLAVNFMLNRWFLYQTLSCRIWGRSAFYQSGGAFGFRDQLQDVMALLPALPHLTREQILRAAAHQFVEGDVQHWWHPPSDAGVRTRFSDDLLWLPYVVSHYVRATGDAAILDESVPFLQAPLLTPEQHEIYMVPERSPEHASLFEHCRRAIEKGFTSGPHGLPLIGIGDWNDGMSRVGVHGKGESVWLAWFLIDVLNGFVELCEMRNESSAAQNYRERVQQLANTIEETAWDGDWYRRAYFDDGSPLGSKTSDEAKIDSIAQSWGVISGAAREARAELAMQSVEQYLVRKDEKMILLYTPPFDKSAHDPGYIKGYLPGVRENGGQYTHAAIWTALAFARRGDGNRAVELLRMLNPVEHARDEADVARYKVEPYVVAADIYALPGQVGRGGWTWYTGSSSWMYRAWIEEVLGFQLRGDTLVLNPTIPTDWKEYKLHYRYRSAYYDILVENPEGVNRGVVTVEMDGEQLNDDAIPLRDDGEHHHVRVILGGGDKPSRPSPKIGRGA